MSLTATQIEELAHVSDPRPDSIHEYDREPERWVRFVARRSTIEALVRLGLAVDEPGVCPIQTDYPVGGYRARLTDEGVAERERIREERRELHRSIRRLATGRTDRAE